MYPHIVSLLKINKHLLLPFTLFYLAGTLVITAVLTYLNHTSFTSGELLVIPLAIVGVIVRIGVYYFRRMKLTSNS